MQNFQLILLYIVPLLLILIPLYLGERYGKNILKKSGEIKEGPVGSIVGATFALLAFLLAFTFQIVESRYSARKELLLRESNEIRSMYQHAGFIPDSLKDPARLLLKEYVDIRLDIYTDPSKVEHLLNRSQEILDELWKDAEFLNTFDRSSEAYSLFASKVDDATSTFHERKIVVLNYAIPSIILFIFGAISFICMLLLGYQIGTSGAAHSPIHLFLALTFAAVIWLILALDRPELGVAKVNPQPLIDLQTELQRK